GNHLIHALRRNVNLKILLFNNRIYGLTKGQYSPTSEEGKVTKSTPMGSLDHPFNPVSLALGAEASFVGRALDSDRKQLTEVLRAAAEHRGSALVEIYQNCPIFNDGGTTRPVDPIVLRHGHPIRSETHSVVRNANGKLTVVDGCSDNAVIHDTDDLCHAFALSRLDTTVTGVFRAARRPTYDDLAREQVAHAMAARPADLAALLHGGSAWHVAA
ncbi:thiamine pyrophosphate-dependent enzyme, partial [Kutzneria kofuensis]